MNQNPTVDNDLQKAIDDITNTTNVDPVFSNPIATPPPMPPIDQIDIPEVPAPNTPIPPIPTETTTPSPLEAPAPIEEPAPVEPSAPAEPVMPEPSAPIEEPAIGQETLSTNQIKEAALRDLVPLLDKVSLDPAQKFDIYRDVIESNHDTSLFEPAYKSAKEILDETKRAEALLYLVESINKM